MPVVETLAYATILFGFVAVCACAANDAATGAAGAVAALTTNLRSGLLLAAVCFAFGLLLLDAGPWAWVLDQVMPLSELRDPRRLLAVLLASVAGTGLAVILATWASAPTPVGLLFVVALATAGASAGAQGSMDGLLLTLGAGLLVMAVAAGVAFLALRAMVHFVLRHGRPRDRLAPTLPVITALSFVLAGLAGLLSFDWAGGRRPPLPASLAALLVLGLLGCGGAYLALRRAPLRFTNDEPGAEAAFRRVQLGGAALVAAFHGAAQTLLLTLPVVLAQRLAIGQRPQSWQDLSLIGSSSLMLPLLCVGGLAVVLAGHRTTSLLGEQLLPTAPVGGVAINLGAQAGALAALALGLPVAGNQAAAGGFLGLAAALRPGAAQVIGPAMRLLGAWLLGPLASAVIALVVLGICQAWIG